MKSPKIYYVDKCELRDWDRKYNRDEQLKVLLLEEVEEERKKIIKMVERCDMCTTNSDENKKSLLIKRLQKLSEEEQ